MKSFNPEKELAEAKQKIRLLRQEVTDKEELAELSHNQATIYQTREKEAREELQKVRQHLADARASQLCSKVYFLARIIFNGRKKASVKI